MLLPAAGSPAARAAQELVVQLDGLAIPIDLGELEAWSRNPSQQGGHQAVWLNLLDPQSRQGLIRLLHAPLLRDRSFGMELLNSWTGEQMLRQVGGLLQGGNGENTAPALLATLQQLFRQQSEVTSLQLLRALPQRRLTLQVDALLALAAHWRDQLQHQSDAVALLRRQPLPRRVSRSLRPSAGRFAALSPRRVQLPVAHRPTPLPLEVWASRHRRRSGPWVLLLPGLGGSSSQLGWLAVALAERGWPVLVVEHPGSDAQAVRASLVGEGPPPGAESVPERLADLQAVLVALQDRRLAALLGADHSAHADGLQIERGEGVVLVGHSLGGLAALMAAGLVPEAGLGERCARALVALPLTNLSRLLQCQLPSVTGDGDRALPAAPAAPAQVAGLPLQGVVTFNAFGSLLWPEQGLAPLPVPVMMVGGSLDLVTPPVQEQLTLLASSAHPRSRLVLVDGASHFSPVRLQGDDQALFRLGEELVGEQPERVQELLLQLTLEFLESGQHPALLSAQRRDHGAVTAYVLDPAGARRWSGRLPPLPTATPRQQLERP